jgi:hypothetical protein
MTYELSPIYFSGYQGTTVFYMDAKASSFQKSTVTFGDKLEAVDGSVHYMHRSFKDQWTFTWNLIRYSAPEGYPLATVEKLKTFYRSVALSGTSINLVIQGQTYNVIPDPNSWSEQLSANEVTLTNVPYYTVSFRVVQT